MTTLSSQAAPVNQQERLTILDSLRGVAILGILLMNIPWFALSEVVAQDPSVWNEFGTINFEVWYWIELTIAGTQRALFSILFGAGIILFIDKKEDSLVGLMPAEYFFRRQLWLLAFGLFNAFILLWAGDVLFEYAICGMILFAFRRWSVKALILAAVVCLLFQTIRDNVDLHRKKDKIIAGELFLKQDTVKTKLTDDQKEIVAAVQEMKEKSSLEARKKASEAGIRKVNGDYASLYKYMSEISYEIEVHYTYFGLWDILIFMFIGMAFFKNGVLLGTADIKVYWILCITSLTVGTLLTWHQLQTMIDFQFNGFDITKNVTITLGQLARSLRSIGVFALIMLLYKSNLFTWLFTLLRPVGQMAFTNYLTQSLMMGLLFYGIGFGLYGKLQRYEIYYVVGIVWIIQITWSHLWLRYFQFGPLEWAWRSLTYWKLQPMKKHD